MTADSGALDTGAYAYTGMITREPAEALAGLLGVEVSDGLSATLPPLWHWVYLRARPPQSELGLDGHPTRGVPAPPGPGLRRMYAGGRLTTYAPLRFDEPAKRTARVVATVDKHGTSGPLTFVTTRETIEQAGEISIVDEFDVVYRPAESVLTRPGVPPATATPPKDEPSDDSFTFDVDPVVLFRFSALTYNAHRIHYDLDYAKSEGYPALVVHGPLQTLLMADMLRRHGVSVVGREFAYRLVAPALGAQRLTVVTNLDQPELPVQVRDAQGRVTATSTTNTVPATATELQR